ncbi:RNA methyltransferase [Desulfonema magnum]|uniref:tRNA (cytidine/uridine-2'-O-)-methyltransferase TrmJ n=1 Tax=Desulfonema magnum TaxID=45655 RepID=A0A975BSM6_9BACT|nr:RNA methyltransferase [Desulfonema magnum]QTA90891.1 tRNA (cytidine/uridine-2'-O-)-methyltransferase [Desulfonema magnum]
MPDSVNLDNISIVLHQPRFPENIGAAARAMRNMGIRELVVVNPENFDVVKIFRMATHSAADIVKRIEVYETLREATSSYHYVVGTTARLGGQRQLIKSPSTLAQKLIPISKENRIAIVFGPEDRGLTNEDLHYCHELVNIPTAEFSSLNLAQAVMVMCYEIFTVSRESKKKFAPRLAARHELDGMYDQLKDILVRISYINPENPDYWMNNLRRFFTRMELRAKEVSIIRGICRQINWYGKKRYEDGLREKKDQM